MPRDDEDLPQREGIRKPYRRQQIAKDFGENLSPLFRWLDKQVGRPWDKVYSELCTTFDMRKTINQHILQHVNGYVERDTLMEGSRVVTRWRDNSLHDVYGLYVHPVTGLLRKAKKRGPSARQKEAASQREALQVRRQVGPSRWLVKYEGHWYFVELADIPKREKRVREIRLIDGTVKTEEFWHDPTVHDVLFRVSNVPRYLPRQQVDLRTLSHRYYGRSGQYAVSKQQASHQDLKRHGVI
jgi:hypothetical protein